LLLPETGADEPEPAAPGAALAVVGGGSLGGGSPEGAVGGGAGGAVGSMRADVRGAVVGGTAVPTV
jgi:hypothetical protein